MHKRSIASLTSQTKHLDNLRVFVIGAGVSASCGFSVTQNIFDETIRFAARYYQSFIRDLSKFLQYLYPTFRSSYANYPNIENFLNVIDAMLIFNEKLRRKPLYSNQKILAMKEKLLILICKYLCNMVQKADLSPLKEFVKNLRNGDILISFNWDSTLELAFAKLGHVINPSAGYWYFLREPQAKFTLLKPHGSVDWFEKKKVKLLPSDSYDIGNNLSLYTSFEYPNLKKDIVPYILPPSIKKEFGIDEIISIWDGIYRALVRADEIYFLGYSFPNEDLHTRFVFRAAIRTNIIKRRRQNKKKLKILVANPDESLISRYTQILGMEFKFHASRFQNLDFQDF